jgi:predicted metalloendopeptidase
VSTDEKEPDMQRLSVGCGATGLPERDYYLKRCQESEVTRLKYRDHIAQLAAYVRGAPEGEEPSDADKKGAAGMLAFEMSLAKHMLSKEEMRDPVATYHKMTASELAVVVGPNVPLLAYVKDLGVSPSDPVLVPNPKGTTWYLSHTLSAVFLLT